MSIRHQILIPRDRRSKSSKRTTERHHIQMDDKVITLFRLTKKSHRPTTKTWYMRCWLGGKTRQKTTGTTDLKEGIKISKIWYGTMVSKLEGGIPTERIHREDNLFDEVGQEFLDLCKKSSETGHRYKDYYKDKNWSYTNYIYPFFKNDYIENVDTPRLLEWLKWRETYRLKSPDLPIGRLKKEFTMIFQILQMGVDKGYIQSRPEKPLSLIRQMETSKKPPSRSTFTMSEYKKLLQVSRKRIKQSKDMLKEQRKLTQDKNKHSFGGNWEGIHRSRLYLHYYIVFLGHSGVRPFELLRVQHKHIKMVDDPDDQRKHLEVFIKGKRRDRVIITKYGSYFSYRGLCKNIFPDYEPDDLVFPTNPHTGLRSLLIESGLRYSINGDKKDSKSLRHFYIMTELQGGTPIENLTQQCDVSYEVIRDHYGRHLQPKMFREQLIKVHHIEDP